LSLSSVEGEEKGQGRDRVKGGGGWKGQEKINMKGKKRRARDFFRSDWKHNVALSTSSQTNPVQLKLGTDRH